MSSWSTFTVRHYLQCCLASRQPIIRAEFELVERQVIASVARQAAKLFWGLVIEKNKLTSVFMRLSSAYWWWIASWQFSSTCLATLLHCKLKHIVARITTFAANLSCSKIALRVEASLCQSRLEFYFLQQTVSIRGQIHKKTDDNLLSLANIGANRIQVQVGANRLASNRGYLFIFLFVSKKTDVYKIGRQVNYNLRMV